MAKVRLAAVLRPLAGGATTIPADAATLRDLIGELRARYPALAERVCADGAFSEFVSVFVDGEDARHLGDEVTLHASTEVTLLPAISGGSSATSPRQRASPQPTSPSASSTPAKRLAANNTVVAGATSTPTITSQDA